MSAHTQHDLDPHSPARYNDPARHQDPWIERNWMVLVILFGLLAVIAFDTWFPTM